jgi:uncharacterized protein (UPF0332 family)
MIRGEDFLKLAEIWITGSSEAEWRCAVSRAYYAAFHEARRLLRDLGFWPPRGDQSHAYLWLRLSNCGDLPLVRAGSDLNSLRRERNQADYDFDQTLAHANALHHVQSARRIVQVLAAGRTEPTRTTILDAMRVYERDVLKNVTWRP